MNARQRGLTPQPRSGRARAVTRLRARCSLVLLGLSGALGLGVFAYVDVQHHSPFEMPVFCVMLGIFIAFGALISNALRCPNCGLHQYYNAGAERELHFCPQCGADFNAALPAPSQGNWPAGR